MIFFIFCDRNNAEEALQKLNGTVIGKQTVRLSWGRNPANKQALSSSPLSLSHKHTPAHTHTTYKTIYSHIVQLTIFGSNYAMKLKKTV